MIRFECSYLMVFRSIPLEFARIQSCNNNDIRNSVLPTRIKPQRLHMYAAPRLFKNVWGANTDIVVLVRNKNEARAVPDVSQFRRARHPKTESCWRPYVNLDNNMERQECFLLATTCPVKCDDNMVRVV